MVVGTVKAFAVVAFFYVRIIKMLDAGVLIAYLYTLFISQDS